MMLEPFSILQGYAHLARSTESPQRLYIILAWISAVLQENQMTQTFLFLITFGCWILRFLLYEYPVDCVTDYGLVKIGGVLG